MLVHKLDHVNGNGLDFREEHTKQFMNTLIDKPVVCSYYPLQDDLGDHEPVFDENGHIVELRTLAIGTITDVWIDDYKINDETVKKALYAKAVVWSYKYPQIMSCIERLFNDNQSTSSVEVEIYQFGDNPTKQYRYPTNYSYLANCLLGSSVTPADSDAGVTNIFQREVASAVQQDLKSNKKGDEPMSKPEKALFNKGYEVKYHGKVETNELSYGDIRDQLYNLVNPIDPQTDERTYTYWIRELYQTYVILEDWDNSAVMFKANYSITNNVVSLDAKDSWQQVEITYQPVGTNINQLLVDKEQQVTELNNKLKEEQGMTEEQIKELQSQLDAANVKVDELNSKVAELNGTIVSQEESKKSLEGQVSELNSQIEDLSKYKEQVEVAEKEAKKTALVEKFSKLLPEDTMKSERVVNALEECNEIELNSIVVEEIAKEKVIETNSKTEQVVVTASKQEDLIPQTLLQKYGLQG
jgi:outer membrane murein-binding lipoprotein Lpp